MIFFVGGGGGISYGLNDLLAKQEVREMMGQTHRERLVTACDSVRKIGVDVTHG